MKEITEDFLTKMGFSNDGTGLFSVFICQDYLICIWHSIAIKGRHWYCTIYTGDTKHMLGNVIIQTVEQFKKVMEIFDINLKSQKNLIV